MRYSIWLLVSLACFNLVSCDLDSEFKQYTSFSIATQPPSDFDSINLELKDSAGTVVFSQEYFGLTGTIRESFEPGRYSFELSYLQGGQVVAGSQFCSSDLQLLNSISLRQGPNNLTLRICGPDGLELNPGQVSPDPDSIAKGRRLYSQNSCDSCHGNQGQGTTIAGPVVGPSCESCSSRDALIDEIARTMPISSPRSCDTDCATAITDFLETLK